MVDDIAEQAGILTRRQALREGYTAGQIRSRLGRGIWQNMHRGVYATFSGPPPIRSSIWAAILAAGPGATVSHETAAFLWGVTKDRATTLHVTIPESRRIDPISGVTLHRSQRIHDARHPVRSPPVTRVEETALDLSAFAPSVDDAIGWLARFCGSRLTTPARLDAAMADRPRIRWRRELADALADVDDGAHSLLELRYLRSIERDHGLPRGDRQAPDVGLGGKIYYDVLYAAFDLLVKLDGKVGHQSEQPHRDFVRDNAVIRRGGSILRFGWSDISSHPCAVAAQVGEVLRLGGWTGHPTPCRRPDCVISEPKC